VLIQGTTLSIVAKWLNVALPEKAKKITEIDKLILELPKSSLQEFEVLPNFHAVNKRIVDLNFPKSAFIVMIKRNGEYIRPGGSTELEAKDILMVLADSQDDFTKVNDCIYSSNNK
ncbi:TrkA C-terminal domain-containing protein, partial [Mariniflexile rhizosphaerae]